MDTYIPFHLIALFLNYGFLIRQLIKRDRLEIGFLILMVLIAAIPIINYLTLFAFVVYSAYNEYLDYKKTKE